MESGKNIQLKLKISVSRRERSREGKGTAHPRRIQDKRDTQLLEVPGGISVGGEMQKEDVEKGGTWEVPPRMGATHGSHEVEGGRTT